MPHRRSEKRTERLIRRFYKHLTLKKGLSEETASAHAHQIDFFAFHYLKDYEGKSILNASGSDIENYLGDWYIQKVLNSTKSDVRPILVAFKKFFKFLYEKRKIEKEQLGDILDFGYEKDRDGYFVRHGLGIEWFTITQLGKKTFKASTG